MTPIANLVKAITASPSPVLFLDTCVFLDIVRAPLRNNASEVQVARLFLDAVRKTPKTIHILVASPTPREWADHIKEAMADCEQAVKGCDAVASICGQLQLPHVAFLPDDVHSLPQLLGELSENLLQASICMDHDDAALRRAIDRIITSTHPAKSGGKGAKDAVILEHALEATTRLRNAGFVEPCIFTSSNTKDFASASSTQLHKDLTQVFNSVKLQYAASLTHANSLLIASGWIP